MSFSLLARYFRDGQTKNQAREKGEGEEGEEEVEKRWRRRKINQPVSVGLDCRPPLKKEFFLLQAISEFLFTKMADRGFDIWLIPELSGAATDLPIVEWIENVELVCEWCEMKSWKSTITMTTSWGSHCVPAPD